jgi:hypothetical protein
MSEVKVNKISPRTACGTVTLGDSGDTFTIPSGATITNAGTASGFGATGETSWDTTVKTTGTFTATAGVGYFLNTTGGVITVNLPVGAAGSSVALADYAGTWQTNKVTVAANGTEKMGGVDSDITLNTEGQSVTFVYIDGTQGWVNVLDSTSNVRGNSFMTASVSGACNTLATAPCCANTKIATFLGPGTFTVCGAAVCAANNLVSYMVVAGGASGGGGASNGSAGGAGGGAGGFREYKSPVTPYTASPLDGNPGGTAITVAATAYPIVVGGGGAATATTPAPPANPGNPGVNSTFSTITSTGGGAGGSGQPVAACAAGTPGGSGGGGSWDVAGSGATAPGGTGNTPPVSPSQGFGGGSGRHATATHSVPGGGGGSSEVGDSETPAPPYGLAQGGDGVSTSITASSVARGGGGGGNMSCSPACRGLGGTGGGGSGQNASPAPLRAGQINTGGGGGGGGSYGTGPSGTCKTQGGAGGSGIVVIRYKFQ